MDYMPAAASLAAAHREKLKNVRRSTLHKNEIFRRSRALGLEKRAGTSSRKSTARTRNLVSVQICPMKLGAKCFTLAGEFKNVELYKDDSYTQTARKAADACGVPGEGTLGLFTPFAGYEIPNRLIMLKGVEKPWTIGDYLRKTKKGITTLKLGVGLLRDGKGKHNVSDSSSSVTDQGGLSMGFTLRELREATSNFTSLIGKGAFGNVYLGKNLRGPGTHAAIKVLNREGQSAMTEKLTSLDSQMRCEVSALTRFRHPNVVDLMGYHQTPTMTALVYEYMEQGSLFYHLHEKDDEPLSWEQRGSILKDTCRGLAYLHGAVPPLIHQDIKSSNILLSSVFVAKVGDFGFATNEPQHQEGRTLVTAPLIARTDGYFAPELIGRRFSAKSDVYSYGVVVLESFTCLKAYDRNRADPELALHCQDALDEGREAFARFADAKLGTLRDQNLLTLLYNISKKALQRHSIRPTSAEVMQMWTEYDL